MRIQLLKTISANNGAHNDLTEGTVHTGEVRRKGTLFSVWVRGAYNTQVELHKDDWTVCPAKSMLNMLEDFVPRKIKDGFRKDLKTARYVAPGTYVGRVLEHDPLSRPPTPLWHDLVKGKSEE